MDDEQLIKLFIAGVPVWSIADSFHVTPKQVQSRIQYLRRRGIPLPARRERILNQEEVERLKGIAREEMEKGRLEAFEEDVPEDKP